MRRHVVIIVIHQVLHLVDVLLKPVVVLVHVEVVAVELYQLISAFAVVLVLEVFAVG